MKDAISGPFQVDDNDIERHETLDSTDLGAWYIVINGAFIFVADEDEGRKYTKMLRALNNSF